VRKLFGIILVLVLVLSFSMVATTPVAGANTWIVDPLGGGDYTTIGGAVADTTNVLAGDTIELVAGEHKAGAIVIDRDLTIKGQSSAITIIKPTASTINWFVIQAGVDFHLSEVTLDGTGYNIRAAIRTHGSGSISDTIIENIRHAQYLGWGIALTWSTSGQSWTISGNEFRNIERVGILVDGAGNSAAISGNTITGNGDGDWVGYGVEVGDGAYAEIAGNTISGYRGVASSDGSVSSGILVTSYFGPNPEAAITGNDFHSNTSGIHVGYLAGDTSKVVANFNNVFSNTSYGVRARADLATSVDATHNWWGDAGGPSGDGSGTGDAVSNADFEPWLGAAMTDQAAGCTADRATGPNAEAETDNVSATATGDDGTTTVTVAEYVGNPTSVSPGFRAGAVYVDVHVGGTLPTQLVVDIECPGSCANVELKWWDGAQWLPVTPTSIVGGRIQATLSATSSPTIAQLTGTPFGLGSVSTVGWEGSSVNKAAVMAPWIALLATMMAGASLLVLRRRRAQI